MGNIISNINPSDVQEVNKVLKKHIKEYENKVTNLKNFSDKKIEELAVLNTKYNESKKLVERLENNFRNSIKDKDILKNNLSELQDLYNNLNEDCLKINQNNSELLDENKNLKLKNDILENNQKDFNNKIVNYENKIIELNEKYLDSKDKLDKMLDSFKLINGIIDSY